MSKKIEVLVGISGSGKSTYAHEQWRANPTGVLVVNRDKIRELMFSFSEESIKEYYSRPDISKLEKQVTKYEDVLIHEGLAENKTVLVDATHLKKEFLDRFQYWNVPISYKYFDISPEKAIERDSKRNRSVGAEVIKRQHNQYMELQRQGIPVKDFEPIVFENDIEKPACYVFDIDGTLAHMGNRSPFDWKKVSEDKLDFPVAELFAHLYMTLDQPELIFCSGRDEGCREETEKWLRDNLELDLEDVEITLYMRKSGDFRSDDIVKMELWEEIAKNNYILTLIDDRNSVCRRARALGLKVFQVEYGNF